MGDEPKVLKFKRNLSQVHMLRDQRQRSRPGCIATQCHSSCRAMCQWGMFPCIEYGTVSHQSLGFAFASTVPGTSPRCSILHPTPRVLPHPFSAQMGAPSPWMAAPYHTWKCSYSLPKKYRGPTPHSQLMGEARSSRTPPDPACRISCPTAQPAQRALNTAEGADLARRVPPSTTGHGHHDQVPCCECGTRKAAEPLPCSSAGPGAQPQLSSRELGQELSWDRSGCWWVAEQPHGRL